MTGFRLNYSGLPGSQDPASEAYLPSARKVRKGRRHKTPRFSGHAQEKPEEYYLGLNYDNLRKVALSGDRVAASHAFDQAMTAIESGQHPDSQLHPREEALLMYMARESPLIINGEVDSMREDTQLVFQDLLYEGGLFNSIFEWRETLDKLIAEHHLQKFESVKDGKPVYKAAIPAHVPLASQPPTNKAVNAVNAANRPRNRAATASAGRKTIKGTVQHTVHAGWGIVAEGGARYDVGESLPKANQKKGSKIEALIELLPNEQSSWGVRARVISVKPPKKEGGGAGMWIAGTVALLGLGLGIRHAMKG